MNIIDLLVIVFIGLYVLNGIYRGFLPSILNLGGFFVSWILSFLTYPLVAERLLKSELVNSFKFYVEGTEWLPALELSRLPVSTISPEQLADIMTKSKLPPPFDTAIRATVESQAFSGEGLTTLGEYYNNTIFCVILNIVSILIVFLVLRCIFTLLTNAFSYSARLPQLRHFEYPMGGAMGLLRGYFSMYFVFMLVPIGLVLLQSVEFITSTINSSAACSVFYSSSILLRFVSGS